MTPETRFHTTVLSITVSVMFAALAFLIPNLQLIHGSGWLAALVGWLATVAACVGTYQGTSKLVSAVLRRFRFLKKWILGQRYLQGTWIGYYKDHDGSIRLIVEHYEQDVASLVVRGAAYSLAGEAHARWTSDATHIDARTGTLIYSYRAEILARNTTHQGIAVFDFQRKTDSAPPYAIEGYSADLTDGIRTPSKETKLSDECLDRQQALEAAKAFAVNERAA